MLDGNELEPAPEENEPEPPLIGNALEPPLIENEMEPPLIGNVLEPPLYETDLEPDKEKDRSLLILGAIFLALILLTTCVSVGLLLNRQSKARQTPTQEFPAVFLPTAIPPAVMPGNQLTIHLPIIRSKAATTASPENVWIVTKIESLAYKSGSQRSDLATFKRIDNQESAQGYCIDRGLPTPKIGAEYALNQKGIFIPLEEPKTHPIQRFQKIQ
jgi:hypothetical protein